MVLPKTIITQRQQIPQFYIFFCLGGGNLACSKRFLSGFGSNRQLLSDQGLFLLKI